MLILNPQHYFLLEQPWWGVLIAFYLFLGGLGAMAFCVSFYFWRRRGASNKLVVGGSITGLIAVLVGTIALVLDLGHPERFYLVLLSPRLNLSSWIAIGSMLLSAFMIFTAAFVAPKLRQFSWLPWADSAAEMFFGWLAFASGIGVAAYTGILIGIVFNIPFWNAPALPLIFMISALSTGLASLILLMLAVERESEIVHTMAKADGFVMIVELIVISIFLLVRSYGPVGAIAAVNMILFGRLAPYFVGGVLLMGLAIPIMLVFGYEVRRPTKSVAAISAILVLIGGALLRYVVLEAGILQIPCCI